MKRIFKYFCLAFIPAGAIFAVSGCNDAKLKPIENAAYIAEAYNASSVILNIANDEVAQTTLTARLGSKAASDLSFTFEVAPEVLTHYNELNGTSYVNMPESAYSFSEKTVGIAVDQVSASPVQVEMSYNDEMKESGVTYAIPVRLICTGGDMMVMESKAEFVLVCNWSRIMPVPVFNSEFVETFNRQKLNRVMFDVGENVEFSQYTFEFMMYVYKFSESANPFMIAALDNGALANRMALRFETYNNEWPNNRLLMMTIARPGVNSTVRNQAGVWQHIAITFDGSVTRLYIDGAEAGSKNAAPANPPLKFSYFSLLPQPVNFGVDHEAATISFREVRLWNVARSASQLANNMTSVDPASEGLVGYWRMDEGKGFTFADATGNGHEGRCEYSDAGDLSLNNWKVNYGDATGLEWVQDYTNMNDR